MPVTIDTTIFHDVNNKMTLLKAYLEILDEKIRNMNAGGDEDLLKQWEKLKDACVSVMNALSKYQ